MIRNAFQNTFAARLRCKPEGFFRKSEGFFRESESFFWRIGRLLSKSAGFVHISFRNVVQLRFTYLPRSRLDLPRLHLGLPRLRLSRNSGPATEGFSNRGINFKDAYRIGTSNRLFYIKATKRTKDSLYSTCLQRNWAHVVNIFQKTLTGGRYNKSNYPMQELWR